MSSHGEVADFTTGNSNPVVCQRCLQSFEEGTELYFMQDRKANQGGKRICAGCRQYYLRKTEARETQLASSLSSSSNILCTLIITCNSRSFVRFGADHSGYTARGQPSRYTECNCRSSKTWYALYYMQEYY